MMICPCCVLKSNNKKRYVALESSLARSKQPSFKVSRSDSCFGPISLVFQSALFPSVRPSLPSRPRAVSSFAKFYNNGSAEPFNDIAVAPLRVTSSDPL